MASPQTENGHIDIANELAEALAKTQLNGYESRFLWVLWRKTYGWHKKEDWVADSQIVEMTGLKKQHVWRTKQCLLERNIVTKLGYKISFQKDYTRWKELPKKVTVTKSGNLVTKLGIGVTNSGIEVTKNGANKRNYTKETNTKEILLRNTGFGNPDINEVSSYFLKVFQIPKEDCSQKQSRQYWYLLLKESKTGLAGLKWLIEAAHEDVYYKNNITSSKDLYYKRVKLLARKRGNAPRTAFFKEEV